MHQKSSPLPTILHFLPTVLLLACGPTLRPLFASRFETCTLRGDTQKALYACPEGFEVIYTGEGSDKCSGTCYKEGNVEDTARAIEELTRMSVGDKLRGEQTPDYTRLAIELRTRHKVTTTIGGEILTFITNPQ